MFSSFVFLQLLLLHFVVQSRATVLQKQQYYHQTQKQQQKQQQQKQQQQHQQQRYERHTIPKSPPPLLRSLHPLWSPDPSQSASATPALSRQGVSTTTTYHYIFLRAGAASAVMSNHFSFGPERHVASRPDVDASVIKGQNVLTFYKVLPLPTGSSASPASRTNFFVSVETVFDAFPGEAVLEVVAVLGGERRTYRHIISVIGLVLYQLHAQPSKFYTGKNGVPLPLRLPSPSSRQKYAWRAGNGEEGAEAEEEGEGNESYIELNAVVHVGRTDRPTYMLNRQDISFILPEGAGVEDSSPVRWNSTTCKLTGTPSDLSDQCSMVFSTEFDRFYIRRVPLSPARTSAATRAVGGHGSAKAKRSAAMAATTARQAVQQTQIRFKWAGLQRVYNDVRADVGVKDSSTGAKITDDMMTSFEVTWGGNGDVGGSTARWKIVVVVVVSVVVVIVMVTVSCWCCARRPTMGDLAQMQYQEHGASGPKGGGGVGSSGGDAQKDAAGSSDKSLGFRLRESVCRSLFGIELGDHAHRIASNNGKPDTPRPPPGFKPHHHRFGDHHAQFREDDEFSLGDPRSGLPIDQYSLAEEDDTPRNTEFESGETYVEPIDVPRERRGVREDLIEPTESIEQARAENRTQALAVQRIAELQRQQQGKGPGSKGAVIVEEQSEYMQGRMKVLNMLQGPATRGVVGRYGERIKVSHQQQAEAKDGDGKSSNTVRYQLSIPEILQGSNFSKHSSPFSERGVEKASS